MNKPSYAIYFLAVGDGAIHCLKLAYTSLRKAGYTGDVYVLCDRTEVPFPIAGNTAILKIREEHLNLDLNSSKPLSFFDVRRLRKDKIKNFLSSFHTTKASVCHMKSLIDEYIDTSKYDYLVYLDADVLVTGSMEHLEDFLSEHNGAIVTSSSRRRYLGDWRFLFFRNTRHFDTYNSANLTIWELLRFWFVQPVCGDIICFPTNKRGKKFLHEWQKECQKGMCTDQAAMQAVLLRGFREEHVLAPHSLFGYGPSAKQYAVNPHINPRVNSSFVHFHGAIRNPKAMEDYYKLYL